MKNYLKKIYKAAVMVVAIAGVVFMTSCEKVSPTGLLVTNSGTDDRVEMSLKYYREYIGNYGGVRFAPDEDEYTFLVGADSHMTTDTTRMGEMLQNSLDNNDILCAHLGDIADTKAEYYIALAKLMDEYNRKYLEKNFFYDEETQKYYDYNIVGEKHFINESSSRFPFYVTVGNHDITHNGWAMFSNIFHASFFRVAVVVDNEAVDYFIFLDSANGTLGKYQISELDSDLFLNLSVDDSEMRTRNVFVFTHTNIFRPRKGQFSSTYPREELYYMLNKFNEWNAKIVFLGHVHKWDDREFGGVRYLKLDAMSERNSPEPGDYLVRVHVKKDGGVSYERVHMNTTGKN